MTAKDIEQTALNLIVPKVKCSTGTTLEYGREIQKEVEQLQERIADCFGIPAKFLREPSEIKALSTMRQLAGIDAQGIDNIYGCGGLCSPHRSEVLRKPVHSRIVEPLALPEPKGEPNGKR